MNPNEARTALRTTAELNHAGHSSRSIAAAIQRGDLRRVHPGVYVEGPVWTDVHSEARHLLRVVAASIRMRGTTAVVSHVSAAALHGWPLFRVDPRFVHISGPNTDGAVRKNARHVARHVVPVPAADIVEIEGISCTSAERTVLDCSRAATEVTAQCVADAAFREAARRGGVFRLDEKLQERFRRRLEDRLAALVGARGVVRARATVAFADGRADGPGETTSRLYLRDLGFAPPRLQVPIDSHDGSQYFVDFGLDDVDAWGEFDGLGKYLDPDMAGARTALEVLDAEKQRQDLIRALTGRSFARWGMAHLRDAEALRIRLAAFGITPPR